MRSTRIAPAVTIALLCAACGQASRPLVAPKRTHVPSPSPTQIASPTPSRQAPISNIYEAATSTNVPARLAGLPPRVYVPNNTGDSVTVIDPATLKVVSRFAVGRGPHHITPSWSLRWLYVGDTTSNQITVIDPRLQRPVRTLAIRDPYNIYYPPDGSVAIVVAERFAALDFRDPVTFRLIKTVPIPWAGVDHGDFSADGRYLLLSCEFSGVVAKVDVRRMHVVSHLDLGGLPIDIKLSPDGRVFHVANQGRHGVSVVDAARMRELRFIPTGRGAHGLTVSRDATKLYVSNRRAGTISVIDFGTRRVVATWRTGGSPDMMQVSPDGSRLWASGRYDNEVYVVDTRTGRLVATIPVGSNPHGLTYFPSPGRFSLGHNGVYR